MDVLIIGAGVGGLTLGLMLHEAGIPCRIYEAAPEIKPLGVGINLLPHAMKELSALGLEETLAARGVLTAEAVFFNRFGQLIYQEPLGRAAGYDWPQGSIHRGDLQAALRPHISGAWRRRKCCRRSAAARSSPATASIRCCASSFTPTRASRSIPASICGAA